MNQLELTHHRQCIVEGSVSHLHMYTKVQELWNEVFGYFTLILKAMGLQHWSISYPHEGPGYEQEGEGKGV